MDRFKSPSVILALIVVALALLAGPHVWKAYRRQVMLSEPQVVTIERLSQARIQGLQDVYSASVEISARNVGYLHPSDETTFELMFLVKPGQIGQEDVALPPVKTQSNLFAPQLQTLELPMAQRPLFESDMQAWIQGKEIPENYNPFTSEKRIGYLYLYRGPPPVDGERHQMSRRQMPNPARPESQLAAFARDTHPRRLAVDLEHHRLNALRFAGGGLRRRFAQERRPLAQDVDTRDGVGLARFALAFPDDSYA